MRTQASHPSASGLAILSPPYDQLKPVTLDWQPAAWPPKGQALVWWLEDGKQQQEQYHWLERRPYGLPLFIVLPPAQNLARAMPLLAYVNALNPRAVLPSATIVAPRYLRTLLALPPRDLSQVVADYFHQRGLLPNTSIRTKVEKVFRLAPHTTSVANLARRLCTSRRTLGRHFASAGIPVPSHWLQFARVLHTVSKLQSEDMTVFRIAARAGYPDGFTLSNQMKRLVGHRPSEIRTLLGWEWVVECWIRKEMVQGGFDVTRYATALDMYF